MSEKRYNPKVQQRKENILKLLNSMDQDKLAQVQGIILTAMLVQETAENKLQVMTNDKGSCS